MASTHITSDALMVFISVCQTKVLGSVGAFGLPAGQPSSKGRELALRRAVLSLLLTPSEAPPLLCFYSACPLISCLDNWPALQRPLQHLLCPHHSA